MDADSTWTESTGHLHFGLQLMKERAASIDADLEIRSSPGSGTVVRLDIPALTRRSRREQDSIEAPALAGASEQNGFGNPSGATLEPMPSSVRHPPMRWRAESSGRSRRASRASCCFLLPHSAPPQVGDMEDYRGSPDQGDKPRIRVTPIDVSGFPSDYCFPERLGHDKMSPVSRRASERRLLALRDCRHHSHGRWGHLLLFGKSRHVHLAAGRGAGALGSRRLPGELIPVPAWRGIHLSLGFPLLMALAIVHPPVAAGVTAFVAHRPS